MPFKDKKKQLEYNKQWKAENKEKVKEYQSIHQSTYRDKKYQTSIVELQKLSYEDQIQYLLGLHGAKCQAILRRINNLELEQDIQKIIHKERQKKVNLRRDSHWEYIKKWMTDRGCDCGENNITKLSFHHLDPSKKENTIRKMCGYSMKRILAELKKGVVKCKNCHTIIHAGTSEEREEFLVNRYLSCHVSKRHRQKNKLLIWEFKKTLSCIKCGVSDPVILLFHHINSKDKHKKISILHRVGIDIINKEIAKTACLCHNCHEDFHYIVGWRVPTTQHQLEQYVDKTITPLNVDIRKYIPEIENLVKN
jgi:hypothetical protein